MVNRKIGFLALLLLAASPLGANIVTNAGFESAFTGWTASGWGVDATYGVHSGAAAAWTGCVGSLCWLSQDLATNPGETYDLSLWYSPSATYNQLQIQWDGGVVADLVNQTWNGFQQIQYTGLAASAGSTTSLSFGGRNDPVWLAIDDVSVVGTGTVPEPGTLALFGLGLLAVAGLRLRRQAG